MLKIGRAIRPGERVVGWIRVCDDTVSRLHCELFWQEDRKCFRLLHRSTTNSTYVNGEQVEDVEIFDGDIIELGATSLEVQKADLRWSKTHDPAVPDWAPPASTKLQDIEDTRPLEAGIRQIPGATVPTTVPSNRRMTIGPQAPYILETPEGSVYPLKGSKIRFGSSEAPLDPPTNEDEQQAKPKPRIRFDTEYELDHLALSYYNLLFQFDEIVQNFKIARVGPRAQPIRVLRKQSGLVWQTELPEGIELILMEGDAIQMADLLLVYKKEET